jgi:hypothetical protein
MGGIAGVIFRNGEWWGELGNSEESLRDTVGEFRSLKRALRGAIRLRKNGSLPLGVVVRAGDDFSG